MPWHLHNIMPVSRHMVVCHAAQENRARANYMRINCKCKKKEFSALVVEGTNFNQAAEMNQLSLCILLPTCVLFLVAQ